MIFPELMNDNQMMSELVDLLIDYDRYTKYNEPIVWNVRKEDFIKLINEQKRAYAHMVIGDISAHNDQCAYYKKSHRDSGLCICNARAENHLINVQRERNKA